MNTQRLILDDVRAVPEALSVSQRHAERANANHAAIVTRHLDARTSQAVIAIAGRFDFSVMKEFRNAYRDLDPTTMTFVVDLSRTSYLDSSALGMLLVLRDYVGCDPARITIGGCQEAVSRILRIAQFDQLFTIVPPP